MKRNAQHIHRLVHCISGCVIAGGLIGYACGQTLLLKDDFDNNDTNSPITWNGPFGGGASFGQIRETNHHLVLSGSFPATTRDAPASTFAGWGPSTQNPSVVDQHTLELRVDLVGANQNDVFAGVLFDTEPGGYAFAKDEDEILLLKYFASGLAFFFWENLRIKNQNVTLVLLFTLAGSDLHIRARVLDKDNANQVLFDRALIDTPGREATLPYGSIRGLRMVPDDVPTPFTGGVFAFLGVWWINPQAAPQGGTAEATFDNFCVFQHAPPQLAIQKIATGVDAPLVRLSWPATEEAFALLSATDAAGPWSRSRIS